MLRIRIRRIRMFLGLLDPDPLVRGMDPDPSNTKQIRKTPLFSYCYVTSFWLFKPFKNDANVPSKWNKQKNFKK
jgi:hypothetical protein